MEKNGKVEIIYSETMEQEMTRVLGILFQYPYYVRFSTNTPIEEINGKRSRWKTKRAWKLRYGNGPGRY